MSPATNHIVASKRIYAELSLTTVYARRELQLIFMVLESFMGIVSYSLQIQTVGSCILMYLNM